MKKFASLLVLIFTITSLGAQINVDGKYQYRKLTDYKKVHWGFTFGINKVDCNIYKNDNFLSNDSIHYLGIESYSIPGFLLGPLVEFKLAKYFDLRMQLDISFTQRNFYYYFGTAQDSSIKTEQLKVPSSFVEMPILLKYKSARYNNMRMYLIAGGNPRYDIAALRKNINESTIRLNPLDIAYDVGLGIEWYLPYFKLSTELKFSHGFMDVLKHDGSIYALPIDKLKTNIFMLSFHFSS